MDILYVMHVYITSLLHVLFCYIHHLQGEEWKANVSVQVPYFPAHKTHFFPEKCDLNSTCVLCADGKYYSQTYKYPYISYTTSLSSDSEICFQIMRSDITDCERLSFLSGDLP